MAENSNRGFGAMDDQQQRKIASKGGQNSGGDNRGGNQNSSGGRGLASADEETRKRVASEGGKPHMNVERLMNGIVRKSVKQEEKVGKV